MMAALAVLSACSKGFGAGLRAVAGHRPAGPWLVRAAGAAGVSVLGGVADVGGQALAEDGFLAAR